MADVPNLDLEVNPEELYREEVFTDRKSGSIRRLTPVKSDGEIDLDRTVLFVGQAQLLTPMGTVPLAFEIDAASLDEAARGFSNAAAGAIEETQRELEEMRREAASSIVVPGGAPGLGGMPGSGKINLS